MSALTATGITFSYSDNAPLFTDFSVSIQEGRATALLGPNGSGKSTLLRLLLGYHRPVAGRIDLLGTPLTHYQRHEIGKLAAYVPSISHLPFNYSVLDYALLGRAARMPAWGVPKQRDIEIARVALSDAGVAHLVDRNVQELSSGELQLVAIARALTQEPRIILMDEPTNHLDPAHASAVFDLIRRLGGDGKTVLFTTHDPQHPRYAADDAILLSKGTVLHAGDAAEALSPQHLSSLYGVPFSEAIAGDRRIPFVTGTED